jgi:ATP diphosphatase
MTNPAEPARPIDRLLQIMARLRAPVGGCPWDQEQSFATIAPYTIEEAYEVADAIGRGDMADLKEELGDLLLQVVYHAQMAQEQGAFGFADVATTIADKMVSRHPHVFGDAKIDGAAGQTSSWEIYKAAERAQKAAKSHEGTPPPVGSALDGVALALPALTRAEKLQKRAGRVGFDWNNAQLVLDKIEEEIGELRQEMADADPARLQDELGDLLFAAANLARHLKVDPEAALRQANAKFERRFHHIEARLAAQGRSPQAASLEEMERLWQEAKASDLPSQASRTRSDPK